MDSDDNNIILATNIDYAENINDPDVLLENIVLLPIVSNPLVDIGQVIEYFN